MIKVLAVYLFLTILYFVSGCEQDAPLDQTQELSNTQRQILEKNNAFGFNLFKNTARQKQGNIVLSPISISMALGMTLNGAKGATKTAMINTLRKKGIALSDINNTYRLLLQNLSSVDKKVKTKIANSIWYRQNVSVLQAFRDTNKYYFDAKVSALDFANPSAKETINEWVIDQTEGKIDKLIDQIRNNHVMFLLNAVYFNGQWTHAFDPYKTEKKQFTRADGSTVQVPMMHYEKTNFYYHATDSLEVAEIPYGNGSFRMTILLPRKGTVDHLVENMSQEKFAPLVSAVDSSGRRELMIPKFEVTYEQDMKNILTSLGMGVAFNPDKANFQGISTDNGQKLYIDKVKHKSYLKVDEEGAEAAAATSVGVGITSMPPVMRIDHPFVLAIREKDTGAILFLGRITHPFS